MVKYRGIVDGRQRGEYKSAQLRATFWKEALAQMRGTEVWPHLPFDDLDGYLRQAGTLLDHHTEYIRPCQFTFGTYHYGGATVHVGFQFNDFGPDRYSGQMDVKIVSNDPVDDVIERLCHKFPYLRKNEADQSGKSTTGKLTTPWPRTS